MSKHSAYPRMAITLLALIGLFDAAYLSLERSMNTNIICPTGDGCATIAASPYALLFGVIPIAYLGILGYLFIFGLALYTLSNDQIMGVSTSVLLCIVSSIGLLFALYLVYLQVVIIDAICFWCMVSAVIESMIWMAALLNWQLERTSAPIRGTTVVVQ